MFILPVRQVCSVAGAAPPLLLSVPGCWLCLGNVRFFQLLSLGGSLTPCRAQRNMKHRPTSGFSKLSLDKYAVVSLYRGPSSATGPLGPASRNRPGPFSSPTVRKTRVSWSRQKQGWTQIFDAEIWSSQVVILPLCLFRWLWCSWTRCPPLFWRKTKKHGFLSDFIHFKLHRVVFGSVINKSVSYLCRVKKFPLWGSFLKFWAMSTAMSRIRLRLVCPTHQFNG